MTPIPRHLLPETAGVDESGHLIIGGVDTIELASTHGTPLVVYDEAHLRNRCREAVRAFGDGASYATKAFLCRAMARLAHQEGLSLDVATGGELHVARAAGVPAERMIFHGNNKSRNELRIALQERVGLVVVDSLDEMDRIEELVATGLEAPDVLVRITPGIEAYTHEFVRTGQDDSKFGFTVSSGAADVALARADGSGAMKLRGIHAHIGSQVFRVDSFAEVVGIMARFAGRHRFELVSIGGGLGVAYVEGESAPTITEYAEAVHTAAREHGMEAKIMVEPGRAIAAAAAVTLYTAGTIKEIQGIRTYVAVDGGMSDNPRPVLYGSGYETFLPRAVAADRPRRIRLVGKHCETGDVLVSDGMVPSDLSVGDVIATPVTGAYGHSMGSNYNKVLRPAVVFVADGEARLVVRRETYDDLLVTDVG